MNGDMERLMERFWAGETSLEEERRLRQMLGSGSGNAGAEGEKLRRNAARIMLDAERDHSGEAWLYEDETGIYTRIVARRRRTRVVRWLSAAAVAAVLVVFAHSIAPYGQRQTARPLQAGTAAGRPETEGGGRCRQVGGSLNVGGTPMKPAKNAHKDIDGAQALTTRTSGNAGVERKAYVPMKPAKKAGTAELASADAAAAQGQTDSLEYFLAGLEKELERIGDSVYTAHIEDMIRTDDRLQRIINRNLMKKLFKPEHDSAGAEGETPKDQI